MVKAVPVNTDPNHMCLQKVHCVIKTFPGSLMTKALPVNKKCSYKKASALMVFNFIQQVVDRLIFFPFFIFYFFYFFCFQVKE